MNCAVTARPTSFFSGCRICQLPSYWLRNFSPGSTAHTSSADRSLHFSSSASGTLGRPSSKRANGFSFVYSIICSRVKVKTWADAGKARGKGQKTKVSSAAIYHSRRLLVRERSHARQLNAGQEFQRRAAARRDVGYF